MASSVSDEAAKKVLRLPPQNLEAEMAVLGGVLLDDKAISKVLDFLEPDDFYRRNHGNIFTAMIELFDKDDPTDIITLSNVLKKQGTLEKTGGLVYLTTLVETTPTAANIQYYAKIVKDKSILRKLIDTSQVIIADSYEDSKEVDEILDEAESKIFEISEHGVTPTSYPMKDVIKESVKIVESLYEKKELITGVPTGFIDLDHLTSGFQDSDLIIIAGRPSMGKTALAIDIARNAAVSYNVPVAVFSIEMAKEQLGMRLLSSEAKVELSRIRNGHIRKDEWPKIISAADKLSAAPIYIDDSASLNPLQMRAKARRLKMEKNVGLVVVDYLQLMTSAGRVERRDLEISDISRSLKAMAKELKIPVVALSQLSRAVEGRENKRPMMADLRESGALEQDADLIIFIYRDVVYRQKKHDDELSDEMNDKDDNIAEIIIGKQRNGPTGTVELAFLKEYTHFESLAKMEEPGGFHH